MSIELSTVQLYRGVAERPWQREYMALTVNLSQDMMPSMVQSLAAK